MPPIISIQLVGRSVIWLLVFALAIVGNAVVAPVPQTWVFPGTAFVLAIAQWGLLLALGDDELVWDIRELCFYDILAHLIGLGLWLGGGNLPLYSAICNTIFLLKAIRLLWWAKLPDGSALVSWPTMGPVKYWCRKYHPTAAHIAGSRQQNGWAYGAIPMSAVAVWALHLLQIKMGLLFWASAIVLVVLGGFRYLMAALLKDHARQAANAESAARETATALANAALTELNLELRHSNAKLAAAEAAATALNQQLTSATQKLAETSATAAAQNATLTTLSAELATANTLLAEEKATTEAQNAELAIATANAEQRADTLRRASHDLRLPLTAIIRLTEDTLAQTDPATQAAMGQTLLAFLTQFGETISDTIELAKLLTNITQVQIAPWTPLELAQFPYQQLKIIANHQETPLLLRISRQGAFRVLADDGLVNRILVNLIGNALQHSNGSKVLLTLRKRGNQCQIAVWDKGRGIPEANGADGAANFAAFATAVANRTQAGRLGAGRHGLGIDNVRELCAAMGGQMQLHSRPERFTVFWFDLPLAGKVTN